MTTQEFKAAFKVADDSTVDLSYETMHCTEWALGFGGKDFKPVTVTVRQMAGLIRYQAKYLNGQWDTEALSEVRELGRKAFIVVGV